MLPIRLAHTCICFPQQKATSVARGLGGASTKEASSSQYRLTPVKPLSRELLSSAMLSTVPRSAHHNANACCQEHCHYPQICSTQTLRYSRISCTHIRATPRCAHHRLPWCQCLWQTPWLSCLGGYPRCRSERLYCSAVVRPFSLFVYRHPYHQYSTCHVQGSSLPVAAPSIVSSMSARCSSGTPASSCCRCLSRCSAVFAGLRCLKCSCRFTRAC